MPGYSASFFVVGRPAPKGSSRGLLMPAKPGTPGAVLLADGRWMRAGVAFDNDRTRSWGRAVAVAASAHAPAELIDGPVYCSCRFVFERPKATKYPLAPAGPPDADKLERCVWDALTGVIWTDDARVVRGGHAKEWGETAGVDVLVYEIDDGEGAQTDDMTGPRTGKVC